MTNTRKHRYLLTFEAGNYEDVIRILRSEADSIEYASTIMDIDPPEGEVGPFVEQPFTDEHIGAPQPVIDPSITSPEIRDRIVGTWVIADAVMIEQSTVEE